MKDLDIQFSVKEWVYVIFIPVKQARQIVLQDLLLRSYSTFEYILSSILRNKRVREHLSQNSKGLQPLKGNAGGKTAGDEGKGLEMRPHHLKAERPVVKRLEFEDPNTKRVHSIYTIGFEGV